MKIKNTFIRYIKLILRPLIYVIYFLSGFFPRDNKIWVFGSTGGRRFADNAKWFFCYCDWKKKNEKDHPYKYIWITRSKEIVELLNQKGLEAHYYLSLKGIYYSLRAGVYIFDAYVSDINYPFSRKAIKINLWHGSPLKKIERDITNKRSIYYKAVNGTILQKFLVYYKNPSIFQKYNLVTASSCYVKKIFLSAFRVKDNRVVITGYPRNDVLIGSDYTKHYYENEKTYCEIKKLKEKGKKVIIYLPTFRDSNLKKNKTIIENICGYNDILEQNNILLLIKPHLNERISINLRNKKSIVFINSNEDIYPLLSISDALITDYSSVFFDYLLLNKPIIFFPYDYEEYLKNDRELYVDYYEEIAGPAFMDFSDVIKEIIETINLPKEKQIDQKYIIIKEKYNTISKKNYSENVYNCITDYLEHRD